MSRVFLLALSVFSLTGCSYSYDVQAKWSDGRLIFEANPQWGADCVRSIEVRAEEDDMATVWEQTISHKDRCENQFPIVYGKPLRGQLDGDDNAGVPDRMISTPAISLPANKLRAGIIYTVATTTGATGYGCGRFRIGLDGRPENLGCR
jgi:hypothetical protein